VITNIVCISPPLRTSAEIQQLDLYKKLHPLGDAQDAKGDEEEHKKKDSNFCWGKSCWKW
jgi:hypothetical protein